MLHLAIAEGMSVLQELLTNVCSHGQKQFWQSFVLLYLINNYSNIWDSLSALVPGRLKNVIQSQPSSVLTKKAIHLLKG